MSRSLVAARACLVGWLTGLWLLLMGSLDAATALVGLAVGAVVGLLVPLPPLPLLLRPRPLRVLAELGLLVRDVTTSTARLAWAVCSTGPRTRSAVVTVPLRAEQDGAVVLVASWLTLTPGTLVVDFDPRAAELHMHVVPLPPGGVEAVRRQVARTEARLLAAWGPGESTDRDGAGG